MVMSDDVRWSSKWIKIDTWQNPFCLVLQRVRKQVCLQRLRLFGLKKLGYMFMSLNWDLCLGLFDTLARVTVVCHVKRNSAELPSNAEKHMQDFARKGKSACVQQGGVRRYKSQRLVLGTYLGVYMLLVLCFWKR